MEIILDKYDHQIIECLSVNARISYAELGRKIALSQSATKERVSKLVETGVIQSFRVKIDYKKLGFGLKVIISLKFKNDEFKKFIQDIDKFPEILSCKRVTGDACLITECVLQDSAHLENLIDRMIPYGIPTTAIQLSEVEVKHLIVK